MLHQFRHQLVDGCARIALGAGEVQQCAAELVAALTPIEARETRALFVSGDGEPALNDFPRVASLHDIDVLARSGSLLDQLAEGRITSHFHPIVHAQDTTRIFGHEALLRGVERDGSLVAPQPIFNLAREAGLLVQLDSAACRCAIQNAARYGPDMQVFINFSPAAVLDPEETLRATVAATDEAGLRRDRLIFEVTEADRLADPPLLAALLEAYRRAGFRVALDDLGAGWSTLNLLHLLRPDFIKLDRELMHGVQRDPVKGLIAGKLLEIGKGMGIQTIVEGIEEPEEMDWVRAHGADYAQGFLFGLPNERPLPPAPRI